MTTVVHNGLMTGCLCLWSSVVVIPWGMYRAAQSANFREYERQFWVEKTATLHSHNPGAMVIGLEGAWIFVALLGVVLGLVYTLGILLVPKLVQKSPTLGRGAAVIFSAGCVLGTLFMLGCLMNSLRWGFYIEGLGGLLAATGLGLGAAGVGADLFSPTRRALVQAPVDDFDSLFEDPQ